MSRMYTKSFWDDLEDMQREMKNLDTKSTEECAPCASKPEGSYGDRYSSGSRNEYSRNDHSRNDYSGNDRDYSKICEPDEYQRPSAPKRKEYDACPPRDGSPRKNDHQRLSWLKAEIARLKTELKRTQRCAEENEKRLCRQLQDMESCIREHNDVLVAKEGEVIGAKNRNKELSERIHDLQENCSDNEHIKVAHDKLKSEHDRMYIDIMKVRREKGALEEELQAAKHRVTALEMQVVELEHDKRSLESEVRNIKRNAEKDFNTFKDRNMRKMKQLENDLNHERMDNQELNEKYRALKREHEDMLPKSEMMGKQLQKEMDKFQQKMSEMLDIHISHLDQIREELVQTDAVPSNVNVGDTEDIDSPSVWEPSGCAVLNKDA